MRVGEFRAFLPGAIRARRRVLAVGKPGVGKTECWEQACKEIGWALAVSQLPLDDPSTIRGYPFRNGDGAEHCLFDTVKAVFEAKKPTVWLLDDLGQAAESTAKAVMRIIQKGELDGRRLPDHVVVGAATNDVHHGAGVTGIIEPLKSRFHTIVEVETHIDDVIPYAIARGWPDWLCAFLRNSPDALNDWKPSKSMKIDGACPRGWEYLAEWANIGCHDPEVWAGCVGKGRATAAIAYKELAAELPDIAQVFGDPDAAPVPDNPAARFLVSCAISSRLTGNNFGQGIKYLNRLPGLFRAFSIRDAWKAEAERKRAGNLPKDHKPIALSRDFSAWTCTDEGKEISGLGGKV